MELTPLSLEAMIMRITEWLETPHFHFTDGLPGFLSNLSLRGHPSHPHASTAMDVDSSSSPEPRRDEITELLSLAVCLPARHRYGLVYDNICYLKALSRLQEGVTGAQKAQILLLLKQQLFARPYHLLALQELAQQSYSRMLSQTASSRSNEQVPVGPKDDSSAKEYFFATTRSLLLAARIHRQYILDMPIASKRIAITLLKVIQGRMPISNADASDLPLSQLSSRLFLGDDSTFFVNVRKVLILAMWRGGKHFKREIDRLGVLGTAKALCEAWMDVDRSIDSPASLQSGMWIVPFIKGCVGENMVKIRMAKPNPDDSGQMTKVSTSGDWEVVMEVLPSTSGQGRTIKQPSALSISAANMQLFGPNAAAPGAKDLVILPFPSEPSAQSVEQWMTAKISEYESVLEDFQKAASGPSEASSSSSSSSSTSLSAANTSVALRNLMAEPKYRVHCARFSLLCHLYDPLVSRYLLPEFQEALLSLLDPLAPGPNHAFLKAKSLAGYFSASTTCTVFEPGSTPAEAGPSLILPTPICLSSQMFWDIVSGAELPVDPLVVKREKTLDSILDGWKECHDLKRGPRFYKSFYKLALVLSGIEHTELHQATVPYMPSIFQQPGCIVPPSASCGRLVDRMTALDLMSHLVNFRAYSPKLNLWTFIVHLTDEHTDIGRAHRIPSLQFKYLSLSLRIMLHIAMDYATLVKDHLSEGTAVSSNQPSTAVATPTTAEIPSEIAAKTSVSAHTRDKGGFRTSPVYALQPCIKTVLSLISYVLVIVERISAEKSVSPEVIEVTLKLAPILLFSLMEPFTAPLQLPVQELSSKMSDIPKSSFLEILRASALLWKLSKRVYCPAFQTSHDACLITMLYSYHLAKRLPVLPDVHSLSKVEIVLLSEAVMPLIVTTLAMDLPNPNPLSLPTVFIQEAATPPAPQAPFVPAFVQQQPNQSPRTTQAKKTS